MDTGRVVIAVPFTVSRKPELKPLIVAFVSCAGIHGLANVDWIAVWFPIVTVGVHALVHDRLAWSIGQRRRYETEIAEHKACFRRNGRMIYCLLLKDEFWTAVGLTCP